MTSYSYIYKLFCVLLFSTNCHSQYQVWLGTTATPKNAFLQPETWAETARLVEGLSVNNTPVRPQAGTPSEGEESLTNQQYNTVIKRFEKGINNSFVGFARTFFKNEAFPDRDELVPFLEKQFQKFDTNGYSVNGILFFDNFVGSDSANRIVFKWTIEEVQEMRDWLDIHHPNVKIYNNARNNSAETRQWSESPLVDDILMEAKPQLWYDNAGSRQTFLQWASTNPATMNKRIIFALPVSSVNEPYGTPNGYQQIRDFVRWLGEDFMGFSFLRGNQAVIMPVTYNPAFTFYPETINNGNNYDNTMTGIALSLIEQRRLFQGLDGIPTQAQAYDNTRSPSLSINKFELTNNSIKLFPNPSNSGDVLNFKNSNSKRIEQIIVTDVTGKIIDSSKNENTLELKNASPGFYFVKFYFENNNSFISKKIFRN